VPLDINQRSRVEEVVQQALQASGSDCLTFSQFLKLIRQIRDSTKRVDNERLRKYFSECDKDGNGLLTFAEAATMFDKLGLLPYCQEDQDEMKNVLLKVDEDSSGDLDFHEFEVLVQEITEMLRSNMRRRENAAGMQLGFSTQQMAELREVFFYLDTNGNGELDIANCRKMLTLLRIDMCSEVLQEHFQDADRSRNGRIDMEGFLHFVRAISIAATSSNFSHKASLLRQKDTTLRPSQTLTTRPLPKPELASPELSDEVCQSRGTRVPLSSVFNIRTSGHGRAGLTLRPFARLLADLYV